MKWICIKEYKNIPLNEVVYVSYNKYECRDLLRSGYFLFDTIRLVKGMVTSGTALDGTLPEPILLTKKDCFCSDVNMCMEDFIEHFQPLAEYRQKRIDEILND